MQTVAVAVDAGVRVGARQGGKLRLYSQQIAGAGRGNPNGRAAAGCRCPGGQRSCHDGRTEAAGLCPRIGPVIVRNTWYGRRKPAAPYLLVTVEAVTGTDGG